VSRPIETIAILGSGIEAALSAFVLKQRTGLSIARFAETETPALSPVHTVLTPSALQRLETAGLGLRDLLALPGSLPSLGQMIVTDQQTSCNPFGSRGIDWAGIGFHHHWLRARQGGLRLPYAAFSPAYRAMQENRFAPPDQRNLIGPLQHESGLHVHPEALFERLVEGTSVQPLAAAANAVEADLVIDARERSNELQISAQSGEQPFSTWRASTTGWTITIPLRNGALEYPLAGGDEDQLIKQPWRGNQVSIGQAAYSGPSLPGLATERVLHELDLLVELLPDRDCHPAETSQYNRIWTEEMNELRALTTLYLGGDDARTSERLRMFKHRGYVRPLDTDLVTASDWVVHALALDHVPEHFDPLSMRLDDARLKQELGQLLQRINVVSGEFPPLSVYLQAIDKALGQSRETA